VGEAAALLWGCALAGPDPALATTSLTHPTYNRTMMQTSSGSSLAPPPRGMIRRGSGGSQGHGRAHLRASAPQAPDSTRRWIA
jgi:hypothetical protein